ncbi:GGDEF domain-containing protein [Companilactobacillus alimentarius]|nr:GGDEF domain-containing protein [Companilactobacillus alimentarius]MDT6952537.1 GGDEF domain-containing protein [Companilactobacillus alimentarius]GEO44773.1 GGDEF domain-containing protein [Companilactobacillus alimentarius]
MLSKLFLDIAPLTVSLFFIMGAFVVFQIIFSGIRKILQSKNINIDEYALRSVLGIIYILVLLFIMQSSIRNANESWIYINFQIVSVIFYTVILSVHFQYHIFGPIILAFMLFNSAIYSWQSWCLAIILIIFYYSLNYIKTHTKEKFPFFHYMLLSIILGSAYWYFTALKFSISNDILIKEIIYLIIMELFTFGYIAILYTDIESRTALFKEATHDKLTETYNYDAFDIDFRSLFKNTAVTNVKSTMMMFDIDHFKNINDTYGHLTGDKVLRSVVKIVQNIIQNTDPNIKLYRTGGEEFNIIFPNYSVQSTQEIVEQIFQAVNHSRIPIDGHLINVTISVGVSEINESDVSVNDFYSRVDRALYHSKRNGRKEITVI